MHSVAFCRQKSHFYSEVEKFTRKNPTYKTLMYIIFCQKLTAKHVHIPVFLSFFVSEKGVSEEENRLHSILHKYIEVNVVTYLIEDKVLVILCMFVYFSNANVIHLFKVRNNDNFRRVKYYTVVVSSYVFLHRYNGSCMCAKLYSIVYSMLL